VPDLSKSTVDWATLIIGALGVLVTIVVTLAVYWRTKRSAQKALAYDYTSAKLVSTGHLFGGDLKIFFSGTEVQDASLVTVTIRCTGGASITNADFEDNIIVRFVGAQSVLAVQFADPNPPELNPILNSRECSSSSPDSVAIEPLLMNPGDRFTLLALVSRFGEEVQVIGRVAGVARIEQRLARDRVSTAAEIADALVTAVGPTWIKGLVEVITKLAFK
jgi:hypothetical protein